jgi:F-type H+-transporting ATPase subunit alpha
LRVEEEVAIIYCGVNNLLRKIQPSQVAEFQKRFLNLLNNSHKDTMEALRSGNYGDDEKAILNKAAEEVVNAMTKKD